MKFNDLDVERWKELDINVDSLWLIGKRDKSGKHAYVYHGNFIPQFNNRNNTLPLRYIEFSVDCNGQTITFNEIVY